MLQHPPASGPHPTLPMPGSPNGVPPLVSGSTPPPNIGPGSQISLRRPGDAPPTFPLEKLGRFLIERKLGEGAFGVVYKASDPVLDRTVALKVAKPEVVNTPDKVARFLREAKTAANLRHPHIVPVFDSGQDGDRFFIASAYVPGRTLDQAFPDGGGVLDPQHAAGIVAKVADALAYAHAKGVIHRDIKPSNIILDLAGEPLVTDFGLSSRSGDADLGDDGSAAGTPAYMAPEQALGAATAASDQYALGCTLYHLLTGRTVFQGSPHQQVFLHRTEPPAHPRAINPRLAKDLCAIVLKCLAKDARSRYESCAEVSAELRRWLVGEPILARPPRFLDRFARWVRRNPTAAVTFAVMTLLTGVSLREREAAMEMQRRWADNQPDGFRLQQELEELRGLINSPRPAPPGQVSPTPPAVPPRTPLPPAERVSGWSTCLSILAAECLAGIGERTTAFQILTAIPNDDRCPAWHAAARRCDASVLTAYGHSGAVLGVAYTPDGSRLLTASSDGTARVWDARTGVPRLELVGHTGPVTGIGSTPDGRLAVTSSSDNTARVWDLRTASTVRELQGHTAAVTTVALFPDGKRVVTGSDDKSARVWDLTTGQTLRELKGHGSRITGIAVAPDGRVVTASSDGTARIWNTATGETQFELVGHSSALNAVTVSPDGLRVLTASDDKTVRVWDLATGKPVEEFPKQERAVLGVAISPDGCVAATTGTDRIVRFWDIGTGKPLGVRSGHTDLPTTVCFAPDGIRVATAGGDLTARIWDARPSRTGWDGWEIASAARLLLASCGGSKFIPLRPVPDPVPVELVGHTNNIAEIRFNSTGRYAVTASRDKTARVWDTRTGQTVCVVSGHTAEVISVAITPNGNRVLIGTESGVVSLWDRRTGGLIRVFNPVTAASTYSMDLSADAGKIAAMVNVGKVWDLQSGKTLFQDSEDDGYAVSITPDGSRIAIGFRSASLVEGQACFAKVYNTTSSSCVAVLRGHTHWIHLIAITPDGRRVVTASWDKTTRVWDAGTGAQQHLFRHPSRPYRITISDDGETVVTHLESGESITWRKGVRDPIPNTDRRWRETISGNRVILIPIRITPSEMAVRYAATAPDPNYHMRSAARLESEGKRLAAAVHHALAFRAYATESFETGQFMTGFWHLLIADLLRPTPPRP